MKWVPRPTLERRLSEAIRDYPVTLLLGPRQCGKTSLALRMAAIRKATVFDLEDPQSPLQPTVARAVLHDLKGLVVIDEIQRQPGLFPLLRVLADRRPLPAKFLILGSAAPELVRGASESLAGRVAHVDMGGFALSETGVGNWKRLWFRGGLPRAYLAPSAEQSSRWRLNFIQSFLERDIPQLGVRVPAAALRRFWTMLAHSHAQPWNAADLGRALGVKEDTARHYLDILTGALMVRQLQPWFENTGKRLVKAPKVYFRDTGILHALLGLTSAEDVMSHPSCGFSWEGFALEEVIRAAQADRDSYFYRTHTGAEMDLVMLRGGRRYGFEFKFADAPRLSRSMIVAREDLKLKQIWIVYPGDRSYTLSAGIEAIPAAAIPRAINALGKVGKSR
ncbi:MAG: ATP-binding protein [Candidatus Omnitrophica bacterium]|nr:ATP-binding protein [Candidatus Omnitrophota bacterium]MBI3021426.1 ATP-binding protein [Candidatus Omnitrophota bacterium]MBI3084059.1 ATP-binding protein [Candidatus Omnitrophota bacterium]